MLNGDTASGAALAFIVAVAILPVLILVAEATLMALGIDPRATAYGTWEENTPTPLPMAVLTMIGTTRAFPISLTCSPLNGRFSRLA